MKLPELRTRTVRGRVYYYVKVDGKQHHLGADADEAKRAYGRIMARHQLPPTRETIRPNTTPYLVTLVKTYLEWVRQRRSPATYDDYRRYLVDFLQHAPDRMRALDLKRAHVLDWLDEHPAWGPSARGNAIGALKSCLNWHVERESIATNPIAGMKKPPRARRETVVTAELRDAALRSIQCDAFRDFYFLLCELMIRPFELRTLEARQIDFARGLAIFKRHEHKTGQRTGRERVVYLTEPASVILRDLAKRHPEGPLLRNTDGNPWTKSAIVTSYRRLRKRVPTLPRDYTAYIDRHTSITTALEKGLGDSVVAELAGHADATMIARVYGHLRARPQVMRKAATQAASGPRLHHPPVDESQERAC